MIRLLTQVPPKIYVACSGGVDSMAALDFLRKKHDVTAAFFNHGTEASVNAYQFLESYCDRNSIPLMSESITVVKPSTLSREEHWRNERYKFLESLNEPVVTAHHLDDAVETWVWSSMHGIPKLPHVRRGNILRPFLITAKLELMSWCVRKNVPWVDDLTNEDQTYMRNYIRHTVMPVVHPINPGIQKTIKKKLTEQESGTKYNAIAQEIAIPTLEIQKSS